MYLLPVQLKVLRNEAILLRQGAPKHTHIISLQGQQSSISKQPMKNELTPSDILGPFTPLHSPK